MKKTLNNKYVLGLGALFLTFSIYNSSNEDEKTTEKQEINEQEQFVELTTEEKIKSIVEEELKKENNEDKKRFISLDEDENSLRLKVRSDSKWMENDLVNKTNELLEELKKEDLNKYISISWYSDTMDEFGNLSEGEIAIFAFSKDNIDRVNFENIPYDKFKEHSEVYYVIPAWENLKYVGY